MKYGIREICDVVLKAKSTITIGNKKFYKGEPVIYFDSLKTSTLEGAATTVYAQGGRGNSRLVAWEGERTLTFTMEDALISTAGFMILSGAGLVEPSKEVVDKIVAKTQTKTLENKDGSTAGAIEFKLPANLVEGEDLIVKTREIPYTEDVEGNYTKAGTEEIGNAIQTGTASGTISVEVDAHSNATVTIEYYVKETTPAKTIPVHVTETVGTDNVKAVDGGYEITVDKSVSEDPRATIYVMLMKNGEVESEPYIGKRTGSNTIQIVTQTLINEDNETYTYTPDVTKATFGDTPIVLVDYYTDRASGVQQIEITADKFGGNYYLEASTLFRDTNGVDMPAEFIIPNCKIQSNFTFTMASSGDPSTFTFTMDAFPDYTRFDQTKKVLAAIQVITEEGDDEKSYREATHHDYI